ncbi:hypothetical protein [Roseateles sp.]|uniref:hypothetical protein n=1 Tax=Roseateles sp. TaxID=1971397 RepID=UPI003BA465CC
MLLSGLSLGAMVFGAIYYVRGLQSQALTVHIQTQAQLQAWTGVEALRQYLGQQGALEAAKLSLDQQVNFGNLSGVSATVSAVAANDTMNCPSGGPTTRVGFNVTGSSGGGNSLLAAHFCVLGASSGSGAVGAPAAITIKGDLDLGGQLDVLGDTSSKMVVDGNVNGSGSLNGINNLYATGNISLGGATNLDVLFSEGNIALSGSGLFSSVQAMKAVALSGTVGVSSLIANGAITLGSNTVDSLTSFAGLTMRAASIGGMSVKGNVMSTNGAVNGLAVVVGSYRETSNGRVASGFYSGTLTKPGSNNQIRMSKVSFLSMSTAKLTASTVATPQFDAYAYRSIANYAFTRIGNDTQVTVRSVSGIADGSYYLTGNGPNQDWLCSSNTYSPSNCVAKICKGWSEYNSCFSYGGGKWTVAGTTMAPGTLWFNGDVSAASGTYYNNWLVTGNIDTAGSNLTQAVNYAGYANVCTNSDFPSLVPTNFCATGSNALTPLSHGNIAFGAGAAVGGVYSGGKISLAASNEVYGSVLAGDILLTTGNTLVHGYVSAARQGSNVGNSSLGSSTKIDLRDLPAGFDPGNTAPQTTWPMSAKLLWVRHR